MFSRRTFAAGLLTAGGIRWSLPGAGTPVATPGASPAATPQVGRITITGEGTLREQHGVPTFEIDLTATSDQVTGTFLLRAFPVEGVEWAIEPSEILYVKPLSAQSPHVKRISGYARINGGEGEQTFLLDLIDSVDDEPQELNFVLGAEAAPFLGEEVKLGCDCGPMGLALRSPFETGGFTITET